MTEIHNAFNVPVPGSPRFQQDTAMAISRIRSALGSAGLPIFAGLTLSGLTATRLMATDADKVLSSVPDLTAWIAGTTNRVTVTDDGDGTITLSTPQDTHTGASPTFAGLTLTGLSGVLKATAGVVSGSATLDDVVDGASYERVAANQLDTGIYIDATTAIKGIASFDDTYFSVTAGAVTLASLGELATTDHGELDGLTDDDHAQYLLVDGTRAMTGDLDFAANEALNMTVHTVANSTARDALDPTEGQFCFQADTSTLYIYTTRS